MKPFNLEKAQEGHPICTAEGELMTLVDSYKDGNSINLIAMSGSGVFAYKENGEPCARLERLCAERKKLMMLTKRKTGWVNIYEYHANKEAMGVACGDVYETKEEAIKNKLTKGKLIDTTMVGWEELL